MFGKCGYFFTEWQYSVYLFLFTISRCSINSNLCFGSVFKIFLNLPSHAKVSSHIIVLAWGSETFKMAGLKSLWHVSLLWLCICRLSIILIRFPCHRLGRLLIGRGSRQSFMFDKLQTLSWLRKNFWLCHFAAGIPLKSVQKKAMTNIATWLGDSLLYKWIQLWINPPPGQNRM